eukprot:TRINITY_DN45829_c0_g1_i1.p1 TRINITY_DN45829_c0_g1~~TRINITY_DN45829_c0_g1_i1.p1  ORF type:complete len:351 (+),score=65.75 TRINITY_DN45829_c0_g1_i1:90-1055(+)
MASGSAANEQQSVGVPALAAGFVSFIAGASGVAIWLLARHRGVSVKVALASLSTSPHGRIVVTIVVGLIGVGCLAAAGSFGESFQGKSDCAVDSSSPGHVSRPAGLPVEPLSAEEERETRILFELCDTDGSESLSMHEFIAMCVKHPSVAKFLRFPTSGREGLGRRASADLHWKALGLGGSSDEIRWEDFKLAVTKIRMERGGCGASSEQASSAESASRLALIPDEDELNLIFDMCDADDNGVISMTELAAFCVKRTEVAQSLGFIPKEDTGPTMVRRRSRTCVETLFNTMDCNANGVICLEEFRRFVKQRRAAMAESARS